MDNFVEPAARSAWLRGYRWRHLLALAVAIALGVAVAMPVFAADKGDIQPQVVGGTPVPDGKYRFMTSIQADTSGAPPYEEHFCGGTLIDRNSVLTAAHCVSFIGRETNSATLGYRDVRLDVGVTVLNSDQGQPRRIDRLSDIRIHPHYRPELSNKYDVAVIELNNPVANIRPIALAKPRSGNQLEGPPGRPATVAGWGDTRPQPPGGGAPSEFPRRMREADPPLVSDASCERTYQEAFYAALMVCAGQTAEDTCQGDSGGPMFVTANGVRHQIGITSFGNGCGASGFPGVYTEVNAPSIYAFIQDPPNTDPAPDDPSACTITGTRGNDALQGTARSDVICGLGGDDAIEGRGGNDVLWGGPGVDALKGGAGDDELYGQKGVDALDAKDGVRRNDAMNGGGGIDACRGDHGDSKTGCP